MGLNYLRIIMFIFDDPSVMRLVVKACGLGNKLYVFFVKELFEFLFRIFADALAVSVDLRLSTFGESIVLCIN